MFEQDVIFERVDSAYRPLFSLTRPLLFALISPGGLLKTSLLSWIFHTSYQPIQTIKHLHSKYPNPFATHVHSLDTLSRSVDPETGIVRSERLIGVAQGAPKWMTKVSNISCLVSEHQGDVTPHV